MTKKNKLRYTSKGNQFPRITLTGTFYLRHRDEELLPQAVKGDMEIYLSTDVFKFNIHIGDYEAMGLEGYLKANIHDGKGWKPLSLEEMFEDREQYFGKRERPIDTFNLCSPILASFAGREVLRTYREHYVLASEAAEQEDEEE